MASGHSNVAVADVLIRTDLDTAVSITISYEAPSRRLRLEGHCGPGDLDRVREAIETFGRDRHRIIVDLTAVTHIDDDLADLVVEARERARRADHELTMLRRAHSQVDQAIVAAEAARSS